MPNRAKRRAALREAHAAKVAAVKATSPAEPSSEAVAPAAVAVGNPLVVAPAAPPSSSSHTAVSAAQLAANRANAQLSTGPRTEAAKAKVSLNAVKTGLTGCTVLLPTDDAALYRTHIAEFENEFQPTGMQERHLVQSLADLRWRLNRIPGLETAVFAKGRIELSDLYPDQPAELRSLLIELEVSTLYAKDLRNLRLHEARLSRRREKELAELKSLQTERTERNDEQKEKPAEPTAAVAPELAPPPAAAGQNGFEFSNPTNAEFVPADVAAPLVQVAAASAPPAEAACHPL